MIRFSAVLVVVGVGLLVAGSVTSKLLLIYIAIGVSAVALLFLIIGAIVNRAELLGREPEGIAGGQAGQAGRVGGAGYADDLAAAPATTAVGTAAGRGSSSREGAGARVASPPSRLDRPQEAPGFAGYEQFAAGAERRRSAGPAQTGRDQPGRDRQDRSRNPERPFVEPEPTRMDWAAGLREAERQERERAGQGGPGQDRPGQSRPGPDRPGRDHPGQDHPGQDRSGASAERAQPRKPQRPFVEPEPTRMDWAAGLRKPDRPAAGSTQPAEATRAEKIIGKRDVSTPQPGSVTGEPEQDRAEAPGPEAPAEEKPEWPDRGKTEARADTADRAETQDRDPAGDKDEAKGTGVAAGTGATTGTGVARDTDQATGMGVATAGRSAVEDSTSPAAPAQGPRAAEPAAQTGGDNSKKPSGFSPAAETVEAAEPASAGTATDGTGGGETARATTTDRDRASGGQAGGPSPGDALASDQEVTVVPGVPRYHRSECILIRFMGDNDLQRMPVERARETGCTPCRACQPDGEEDD